jgi:hypothetical protein
MDDRYQVMLEANEPLGKVRYNLFHILTWPPSFALLTNERFITFPSLGHYLKFGLYRILEIQSLV